MDIGARGRRWVLDAGPAVVLALIGARYTFNQQGMVMSGPGPLDGAAFPAFWSGTAVLVAALAAAPLVLRRRFPLLALVAVASASVPLLATNPDVVFVACITVGVAIYNAAAHGPHRLATLAVLPFAGVLLVVLFQNAALPHLANDWIGTLILLPTVVAAAGIRVRRQREERERERRVREQAEALQAAVVQERARIARELHDVVTHHVSMMVIQTGAARTVLTGAPDDALEALLAVEATGRSALGDLREMVGALTAAPAPPRLSPPPGLAAVPELIGRVRGMGTDVAFAVTGAPRAVPDGVGLTAYRVIQEGLTNAMKHAAGASAAVAVEYAADRLLIEVTDAGAAPPATDARDDNNNSDDGDVDVDGGGDDGHGLAGLRERVGLCGGTFESGPRGSGGYLVRAQLPLDAR